MLAWLARFLAGCIGFVLCLAPAFAHACQCVAIDDVDSLIRQTGIVFSGRALVQEPVLHTWPGGLVVRMMRTKFSVETAWKGVNSRTVDVAAFTDGDACGIEFAIGETYLIFAGGTPASGYVTSACTRAAVLAGLPEAPELALATYAARLAALDLAIEESADKREALRRKGRFLLEYRDWQAAARTYDALLRLEPSDPEALRARQEALDALER